MLRRYQWTLALHNKETKAMYCSKKTRVFSQSQLTSAELSFYYNVKNLKQAPCEEGNSSLALSYFTDNGHPHKWTLILFLTGVLIVLSTERKACEIRALS